MKEYQSLLFPYAYNILGSAEDAKDAIQDVLLNYSTNKTFPDNEKNYLIKGVINRSINIKSRKQKMQLQEHCLPDPVATSMADPTELRDLVSYSILYVLDRIPPKERAVFILKEAFSYTHQEIADVLSVSVQNSRKLLSRAHKKLPNEKKPTEVAWSQQFKNVEKVTKAIQERDLSQLHQLLADDITFHADGGGKIKVVKKYCHGSSEVADLLVYAYHKFQYKFSIKPTAINYQPALLFYHNNRLKLCQVFHFNEVGKANSISVILDPGKLDLLKNNL